MRNIWIIAYRELGAIFVQPIAYIFAIGVIGITGFIFAQQLAFTAIQGGGAATVDGVLGLFTFLFIFLAPAITMRLLSEEEKSGTMELLMTLPVRDGEVVLGKFLGAFIFYIAVTVLTAIYPIILFNFGNPDIGPIWTGYLGTLLWGAALIAIGVLSSALSQNQMVAFILGLGISLFLYLASGGNQLVSNLPIAATIFSELSFRDHLNNFLSGLIVAKDVLYYVGVTAIFLFAAIRVQESRRWR